MITLAKASITFDKEQHRYFTADGRELQGITQTLVHRAYPDTYQRPDNYTEEQWQAILDNAARKGTLMHSAIELYEDMGITSDAPEFASYLRLKEELDLTHIASEYLVTDNERYATAIDGVYTDKDGGIVLTDYKRTYQLHEQEVTMQLSICKRFFELQNPGLRVARIICLWMRNDKARALELTPISHDIIDRLIQCDIDRVPFTFPVTAYGELPTALHAVEDEIIRIEEQTKAFKARYDELKAGLLSLMQENNVKQFKSDRITLTRVEPSPRATLDQTRLKEEHPDIYNQYIKTTAVKPSIKITIKNQ